jgi:hypothetical protein
MTIERFVREERAVLLAVGALAEPSLDTVVWRLGLLRALEPLPAGAVVSEQTLLELLEELELPLSLREATSLAERSGLLERDREAHRVPRGGYDSERWFDGGAAGLLGAVEREELHAAFGRDEGAWASADVGAIRAILVRNSDWALEIAGVAAQRGLVGLPVFWDCAEHGHEPFVLDPGSMATTDAVHLCVERTRRGIDLAPMDDAQARSLAWLWERTLALQRSEPEWEHGAFALPRWDDDFVGTFDPQVDAGLPCPTTDATGNAVLALSAFALSPQLKQACADATPADVGERSTAAVLDGVDCLLRWQLDDGGWNIHRYPEGTPRGWQMAARDLSSRYAIEALAAAATIPKVDERRGEEMRAAARRFAAFLLDGMALQDGTCRWGGAVDGDPADERARLRATAVLTPTVAMVRALGVASSELDELEPAIVRYLGATWTPDASRHATVSFRVPTRHGPGDRASWRLPLDPVVACALLASERTRCAIAPALATHLHRTLSDVVLDELHGHWAHLPMRAEGKVRGMTGNSRHYHRLLLDYLTWQASLLPSGLVMRSESTERIPTSR